jgi:hypothetical protein
MRVLATLSAVAVLSLPYSAHADRQGEVIVGSVLGATTGAVIGHQLGGRDGAIVGGVLGAAAGVAIATDGSYRDDRRETTRVVRYDDRRPTYYRERVVVESPRYYYAGNDFVYGYPRHDHGHHRGWYRDEGRRYHHNDRGRTIVIVQPAPNPHRRHR